MLKWCPEPFAVNPEQDPWPGKPPVPFRATGSRLDPGNISGFEKDPGLCGKQSLWDLMNSREREQLLDTARKLLEPEFADREKELRRQHEIELAEARAAVKTNLDSWSREFSAEKEREIQELSVQAGGLALAVARKIIRDTVAVDPAFVTRTLETALYKVGVANPLTVTLHPDDASNLQDNPELAQRLRIENIIPDRRVEKGGCRIHAGVREWDVTIPRQLKTLEAIIEETLAAVGDGDPACPGGDDEHILG